MPRHLSRLLTVVALVCAFFCLAPISSFAQAATTATETAATVVAQTPLVVDNSGIRAGLILLLFIAIAAAIAVRKLPAMLALPLMALGIGIIAGVPFTGNNGILQSILEGKTTESPTGSFQLYKAIIWVLFGGIFARFISDARIAERIIKYAAEYGGENPFNVSLLMAAITIMIFTAAGGLPMIIMLGTVMFPILLSLGVPATVCGSILLLAFPIGACLNPSEWARISEIFSVPISKVKVYFLTWAIIQMAVLVLFLTIEFLRMKRINLSVRSIMASLGRFAAVTMIIAFIIFFENLGTYVPSDLTSTFEQILLIKKNLTSGLIVFIWIVLITGVVISQYNFRRNNNRSSSWGLLTPILPLLFLLILGFNNAFIPAFMASLAYGVLTNPQSQALQKLSRSIINGVADVAAPVMLMIGVGMLIAAATHPTVEAILTPRLARIMPTNPLTYVLFFTIASPLALYRGPLNSFGLGVGVARLMQNFMPAPATMGALTSVSMLQDPTTTQNVWICGFLKLDINALLFKLFFYSIGLVIAGLILSAVLFFP